MKQFPASPPKFLSGIRNTHEIVLRSRRTIESQVKESAPNTVLSLALTN